MEDKVAAETGFGFAVLGAAVEEDGALELAALEFAAGVVSAEVDDGVGLLVPSAGLSAGGVREGG
jgi:hypothetical protein